ncbi:MAG: hypothetical protein KIT79_13060 [Deltaproteobacteria bacterium]|nr:hypothetical protein [Deltaproteobacteria bacterium]
MPTVISSKQTYITRSPDGLMIGPVSRRVVVELIRDRKVSVGHTFSVDGGPQVPIYEDDEFRQYLSKFGPVPAKGGAAAADKPVAPAGPRPSAAAAPAVSVPPVVSEQTQHDLEMLDDEDDDDDDSDFTLSFHEVKDVVLSLSRQRQKLEDDEGVLETLDDVPLAEIVSADDEDVVAIGDEMELPPDEVFEEVEVLELEAAETGPVRQAAKVPTSGRARLKAELTNPSNRYKIQNPDGLMLGPVRIPTVRDLVEAGAIDRRAKISKNDGPYVDAWSLPEVRFLIVRLSQKKG